MAEPSVEKDALAPLRDQMSRVERAAWDAGHDVHPDALFCVNYREALAMLGRLDPPILPPRPDRAVCDHRFPDGTLCKLTRAAHEDVLGLASLHSFPPETPTHPTAEAP